MTQLGIGGVFAPSVRLIDESGTPYGVKHVSNKMRVSAMPYLYDIAEGNVSGHSPFRALGYNADIDDVMEDLWVVGGSYVFPASAAGVEVVSSDAADTADGTGARTVDINYLDTNYAEQEETITLAGATPVPSVATNIIRINHFHVMTVGSGGYAAGNIDVRHLDNTPIYARIPIGSNVCMQAIWTVPAGKVAYITSWQIGAGNASGGRYLRGYLRATSSFSGVYTAGVFHAKDITSVQDGTIVVPFDIPIKLPARTDIKISAISDAAVSSAICAGHFEGWYESE